MNKEYTGWIPTVGGRLSFSVIGETSHPQEALFFNEAGQKKRCIFGFQHRDLSDASPFLFYKSIYNYLNGISGDFIFALYGSANDVADDLDAPFEGKILLFYSDQQREVSQALNYELARLSALDDEASQQDFLTNTLEPNLLSLYKQHGIYMLDVVLDRSGRVTCSTPDSGLPKKLFNERHDISGLQDVEKHVASELFFFLKDVCHRHQHHSPRTDTIVDLHDTSENKLLWKNETLRALYKRVLDFKRSSSPGTSYSALGMLSYIRSFKRTFCSDIQINKASHALTQGSNSGENPNKYLFLNDEELEASIRVCLDKRHAEGGAISRDNSRQFTWLLGIFTIMASGAGLLGLAPKPENIEPLSPYLVSAVNFLIKNEVWLLMPFVAIYFVPWARKSSFWKKEFERLLVTLPKHMILTMLLALIGLLLMLAYSLFIPR